MRDKVRETLRESKFLLNNTACLQTFHSLN